MTIDAIGARSPIRATVNADVSLTAAITADGSARDLTGATLSVVVQDNSNGKQKDIATYSQTITDAAAGLFTFYISKAAFKNMAGEELSWNLVITESGVTTSLAYGTVIIEEIA